MAFAGDIRCFDIYRDWFGVPLSGAGGQSHDGDHAGDFRVERFCVRSQETGGLEQDVTRGKIV